MMKKVINQLLVLAIFIFTISCEKTEVIIEECEEPVQGFQTLFEVEHQVFNSYNSCVESKAYVIRTRDELLSITQNCPWYYDVDFDKFSLIGNVVTLPHNSFTVDTHVSKDTLYKRFYYTIEAKEWTLITPTIGTVERKIWVKVLKVPSYYEVYFEENLSYPKLKYQ